MNWLFTYLKREEFIDSITLSGCSLTLASKKWHHGYCHFPIFFGTKRNVKDLFCGSLSATIRIEFLVPVPKEHLYACDHLGKN